MEIAYSVGVSNRFASLMADEDDPGDQTITPANAPEKIEKEKPRKDFKSAKQKDNREKGQQTRKNVQDPTKQSDKSLSTGRGRGGRQDNRRNQGAPGEEREYVPRGEGRGRGGRGGRSRLASREKENDGGFSSGDRGFTGGERGFSGGDRGFSGGDRVFSGGDREDRGEGRGRGRFRGSRGGGRGGFRGKREFERRSGSDKSSVKAVEKREGGGAHNWGKREDVDDWPDDGEETQPPPMSTDKTEGEQNGDAPTTDKTEEQTGEQSAESPVKEQPEEDNQLREMTLDEYKTLMSKSSKEIIKLDMDERKPGENVDSSQWKDTIVYERHEGEYFPGTREVIEKPKTSGRIKTTLDANFYFRDPARRGGRGRSGERGGRGGRGGEGGRGRGGRGEGRGRGGEGRNRDEGVAEGRRYRSERRDHGKAPNVEDTLDFPTLPGVPITAVDQ